MERTQIPNPHKCHLHKHLIASGAGPCAVSGSQRGPARPGEQALPGRRSCGETPRASGTSPRLLIFQEGVPQSHSWGVPASRAGCEHSTRPLWRRLTEGQTPTDCSHTVTRASYSRIIPHLRARTPFSCQMLAQRLECGQRRRGVLNACGRGRLGRAGHTAGWALLLVPQDQPETPPHEAAGAAVPYGAPTSFRHDVGTLALSYRHSLDSKL